MQFFPFLGYKAAGDFKFQVTKHPFHMVKPSPWPFFTGLAALVTAVGAAQYMHFFFHGGKLLFLGFTILAICVVCWWRDVVIEATYYGDHTRVVQRGLRYGMILFIVSEIMFFFAFFWAFFHSSLAPAMEIGFIWPPKGIHPFCPAGVPFLNTLILLSSGSFITWSHYSLEHNVRESQQALALTVGLGVIFTFLQYYEYGHAAFKISDSIYGSLFFMLTGFHGFHVLVGTIFLCVCLYRMLAGHFRAKHHVGFEAAIWYWHFVDVVWIFLFISIYWWGSRFHS
jgi:heme/copper-type cytochrome/quinol oxidase subunit 3